MWADAVNESLSDVSYFVEMLSDGAVEALAADIAAEVLADVDVIVSAAVMIALEISMLIP